MPAAVLAGSAASVNFAGSRIGLRSGPRSGGLLPPQGAGNGRGTQGALGRTLKSDPRLLKGIPENSNLN